MKRLHLTLVTDRMFIINAITLLDCFLIMHARTLKMLNKKNPCCKYFFIFILLYPVEAVFSVLDHTCGAGAFIRPEDDA